MSEDPETVHYDAWVENFPDVTDKVVAITGTTSGTGYWAAVASLKKNVKALFLLNRQSTRADEALDKLKLVKQEEKASTEIIPVDCDLMSFGSVKEAAEKVKGEAGKFGGLTVLANNAGIMAFPDERTKDGYDKQMQTNHLSHFYLTKLLLPSFKEAYESGKEVRIVQHSSAARNTSGTMLDGKYFEKSAEGKLGGNGTSACLQRYHQSKLSNSTFAMALHKKLSEKGYDTKRFKSLVAEPGYPMTNLGNNIIKGHQETSWFNRIAKKIAMFAMNWKLSGTGHSAADGSLSMLECMFGANIESGDFFHPEHKRTGKPYKAMSKGEVVPGHPTDEKLTLSEQNQKLVWEKSEEALGDFFEFA